MKLPVKDYSSLSKRTVGLLDKSKKPILLRTRFGIHTFLMKKPIKVLILSGNKIKRCSVVKPNRFLFWDIRYSKVVEIPFESEYFDYGFVVGSKISLELI